MGYAQKRLASTAAKLASVSPSHVRVFPPKEAVASSSSSSQKHFFDAQTWASLQPPPPTSFTAFAHRIGLGNILTSIVDIQRACTHPSFVPLYSHHYPDKPLPATNANLAVLGNSLLGLFATEYVNASYPHLPTRVMKAAVSAYVGPTTCVGIAKEMGVTPLLRWNRTPTTPTSPAVLHPDALSSVPRALTALVYQHRSLLSARKFVHKFFLSREVDVRNMIKFRDPKAALAETVAKFGRERPISRLLKETGRFSNSPVFVVGIYSGADKLGEGFGTSLKMAEYRAAEDSLHRLYLIRQPSHLVQLPTSTFAGGRGNVFEANGTEGKYLAGEMGDSEVLYGSAGRTGQRNPGRRSQAIEEEDLEVVL
ncbi:uncharacterized protein FIBRA_02291 [Fibroporia radiculosa]|uniref:Large ribosomal subunit protein mL44 n=1 Tax=Fibroporia radiculosa TaxID=599839 RepID=J4I8Z3_9APHY|nr:uncharacterized protein FIBRA_02291 [Fibroporia radiculosa]CCM00261.1 predicted protein [Fibroporia radiculosa]